MKVHIDVVIGHLAAGQHGAVSLAQLRAAGLSDDAVRARVSSRRLRIVHPGVYRVAAAPPSWEGALLAATLAAGPAAFASHHSFARLFGLRGTYGERPEIVVAGTACPTLRGVRIHRIDRIDRIDVTRRFGIPVLGVPLGLLLLGSRVSERALHNAVHDALFLKLTTRARLQEILRAYGGRGRRGCAALRRAVGELPVSGATQSGLELDGYRLLVAAGIGDPVLQHPVLDGNGRLRKLDVAYVAEQVDIEFDGGRWHDPAEDAERDAAMRAIGWEVRRYREEDVHDHPAPMLREVQDLLLARRRSLSAQGA